MPCWDGRFKMAAAAHLLTGQWWLLQSEHRDQQREQVVADLSAVADGNRHDGVDARN